ncbi:amidohydrolase family protein [Pseudomonadota bacterium]
MPNRVIPLALLAAVTIMTAGCSNESEQSPKVATESQPVTESQPAELTRRFDWYMEKVTPAGRTTLTRSADDRVANESFVHWNNREYTLNSTLQLDENGMVVEQTITGISPFGAPIDESFSWQGGVASWKTVGEGGSVTSSDPAFYLPNEWAAVGAMESMVQAAAKSPNGELALFPKGRARVEKMTSTDVESPEGPITLSLWAIFGTGFTPSFAWFDDDMNLQVSSSAGWLGMVPEGWGPEVLVKLDTIQLETSAELVESIAGELAIPVTGDVVFANVAVADVEAQQRLENHFVRVRDGRIEAVSSQPLDLKGATVIDGTGKTLIPGLWDMHGHFSLSDGILNIAGGITSVRDIGGEHESVMQMTAKIESGQVIGPTTYRAGFMDRAGPFASGWAAESLEDALGRVDFFAENGYLQVKLYSSIEPEWVAPIAERAHSHGMRVSGHIPAFMSAEQAVSAGYDEIQHINMVFLNFLAGDRVDTRKQLRFTLYGDEAGKLDLQSQEVQDFLALLKENNVVIDPTAAIFETMLIHLPGQPDPTFAAIVEHLPPSVARRLYSPEMDIVEVADAWALSSEAQSAMLKLLYDNGIQLVPGSDHMAAFTVHRELETYAEAGIPNAAVLRIATLDSANLVGAGERTGSITVGKQADLVLVEGDPFEDISAVRRATLVMKGKTAYQPNALYQAVGVVPFLPSEEFGFGSPD